MRLFVPSGMLHPGMLLMIFGLFGVEVLCTTPHIYEQKTAQTMATSRTCLSTTSTLACT